MNHTAIRTAIVCIYLALIAALFFVTRSLLTTKANNLCRQACDDCRTYIDADATYLYELPYIEKEGFPMAIDIEEESLYPHELYEQCLADVYDAQKIIDSPRYTILYDNGRDFIYGKVYPSIVAYKFWYKPMIKSELIDAYAKLIGDHNTFVLTVDPIDYIQSKVKNRYYGFYPIIYYGEGNFINRGCWENNVIKGCKYTGYGPNDEMPIKGIETDATKIAFMSYNSVAYTVSYDMQHDPMTKDFLIIFIIGSLILTVLACSAIYLTVKNSLGL